LFITLEGIDGCGKSTQASLLVQRFKQCGVDFISLREPGGTPVGEAVRQVLLDNRLTLSLESELLLYMAARTELVEQVIIPALKENKVVLCDRFTDSTVAYQGYGGGADLHWIQLLNNQATRKLIPSLTILLDLPVEEATARRVGEKDRMESKDIYFHGRVRNGYLELARKEPQRINVLDATETREIIHDKIWVLIEQALTSIERS